MSTPIKLKIVLENMPHEVYRKILVPGDINMLQLHYTIQLAMGWTFSHLFQFSDKKWKATIRASYGNIDDFDVFDVEESPADLVSLNDEFLEKRMGKPFLYWYDYGDDWWHKISFLKLSKEDTKLFKGAPKCVDAVGVCPPENIGGPSMYQDFYNIVSNPKSPEYNKFIKSNGLPNDFVYNTDYVDINVINAYLTGYFFSPDWKLRAEKLFEACPTPFLTNLFNLRE